MGPLGWQETLFIFILALLLFGPKKLPELGKTIGKAVSEFRRASAELKSTFDREMSAIERENESLKEVTSSYNPEDYSYNYNYNYESSSYGSDNNYSSSESADSTATNTSTASASATEGAESPAVAPGGTVASGTLAAAAAESSGGQPAAPAQSASAQPAGAQPAAETQAVKS